MLCYETVLDPEGVDVLVPPRSARGLQPHEIAIVITRHLYPSHHLVPLREKVKDLYSEVGEPPPKPLEGSLNLPRPEGDALFGPLLQVESRLGVVTTLRMVNFIEKLVVLVIQRLKVRSHQLLVGFRLLHGLPPSSDERRVAQLLGKQYGLEGPGGLAFPDQRNPDDRSPALSLDVQVRNFFYSQAGLPADP